MTEDDTVEPTSYWQRQDRAQIAEWQRLRDSGQKEAAQQIVIEEAEKLTRPILNLLLDPLDPHRIEAAESRARSWGIVLGQALINESANGFQQRLSLEILRRILHFKIAEVSDQKRQLLEGESVSIISGRSWIANLQFLIIDNMLRMIGPTNQELESLELTRITTDFLDIILTFLESENPVNYLDPEFEMYEVPTIIRFFQTKTEIHILILGIMKKIFKNPREDHAEEIFQRLLKYFTKNLS